jgi:hypothetical protein
MTADDYVGVILGTFTFFLWALIGVMQWFGSRGGFQCPAGTSWERFKVIDVDHCGVEFRASPINCIDNAVETGTLLSVFLPLSR